MAAAPQLPSFSALHLAQQLMARNNALPFPAGHPYPLIGKALVKIDGLVRPIGDFT